jgi:microcystin-dependent protein
MATPFLGQITMFSGGFAPKGFALCNGQLLPINQNQALFSLLGTTYGGNGQTTFALPNLQSQLPVHQGQGAGLSNYILGQTGGTPAVTIDQTTMPSHNHAFNATTANASSPSVGNTLLPGTPTGTGAALYANQGTPPLIPQTLAVGVVGNAGGSQPHTNLMPSLCISFVIALQGIFPSRN